MNQTLKTTKIPVKIKDTYKIAQKNSVNISDKNQKKTVNLYIKQML